MVTCSSKSAISVPHRESIRKARPHEKYAHMVVFHNPFWCLAGMTRSIPDLEELNSNTFSSQQTTSPYDERTDRKLSTRSDSNSVPNVMQIAEFMRFATSQLVKVIPSSNVALKYALAA